MTMSDQARVVVITDSNDAHISFVERHLRMPLIVIDPKQLPAGRLLSYKCSKAGVSTTFDGVDLSVVSGVWYRKPQPVSERDLPVPPMFKRYSQTALQRHAALVLSALGHARWVSDYYAMMRANNKFLQLTEARRIGFNVPATLITSDKDAAKVFIEAQPQCVVKPLSVSHPREGTTFHVLYTTRVDKGSLPDLRGLYLSPTIFQQAIDVDHDVRVTVVGERVFAARIQVHKREEGPGVYDNRYETSRGNTSIVEYKDFPANTAKLCVAHVKALGLEYGAIDLVVDKKGKFWFLENNPNGQWAFVEDDTGQPIGKALASLLEKRP